jgi:hypothetical protein
MTMKFEYPFRRFMFAGLSKALFFALSLLVASLMAASSLRADQSQQETIDLLTTGQWMFHGVARTFRPDGTYSSKSAQGTWSINGDELDISLGRSMMRFNLPLDPGGTQGLSAGGIQQTLSRVDSGDAQKQSEHRSVMPVSLDVGGAKLSAAHLVQAYHQSLVFVTGTEGAGSGFVASMGTGNFLVTNVHVVAGLPTAEFKTLDGAVIHGGSPSMAQGEDVFCMALPAGGSPLQIMNSVESNAAIGDAVVVLGNAEGEGVINTITGRIVGIGPNLVEVDAPFVPGNSGSPIIHLKTGKVIGIATYMTIKKYDVTTTKRTMVRTEIRRFGYRLDNVRQWQPVNWAAFRQQAAQLEGITDLTDDLYSFLGDFVENRHAVNPARYTNPVLKDGLQKWCDMQRGSQNWRDGFGGTAPLLTFLKAACESDIGIAQRQSEYDYFQRELAEQKEYRDAMEKAFEVIVP